MTTLIANELIKLRTVRTAWYLLAAQLAVVVMGASGRIVTGFDANDPNLARTMIGHAGVASLFALILGINAVAGEYRHRTITDTYLGSPGRIRVIAAKLVAYSGVGFLFGVIAAATAVVVTSILLSVNGVALDLASGDIWSTVLGAVAWNVLFTAIGVSIGAVIPNLAGAIAVALAWIALVEGLVGQLVGTLARWLPMQAGMSLGNSPIPNALPQLEAGLVLVGYAALLAVAAAVAVSRRDVT